MLTAVTSSTLTPFVRMLSVMAKPKAIQTLGTRLRRSRDEANLSQDALAKAIGATRSAISQAELGMSHSLNAENLIRAALRMGKSPLWLSTGEGPENSTEAIGRAMSELPDEKRQQAFDFVLYQVDRAKDVLGERSADYMKMIERIRADMEKRPKPE